MPIADTLPKPAASPSKQRNTTPPCYHCGEPCLSTGITTGEKVFCCEGCKTVFEILDNNGLCNYYALQNHPGLSKIKPVRNDKFVFLDDQSIADTLCHFRNGDFAIVTLYLPGVHCSSCMWLLEHLPRLHAGILESRLNFSERKVTIHFTPSVISLRALVELLTTIGYEPAISLADSGTKKETKPERKRLSRLGLAGFCFSFIMMMSLPEYFGGEALDKRYSWLLRSINMGLALPVFFYCAGEFFSKAWKGLKARTLHIDAPIALAILITFSRSVYEIFSGTGAGYLDSMSGIVFFMLVGRVVQERTYQRLRFHRDYQSYFPLAVSVETPEGLQARRLTELRTGDVVTLHNDEIIPADGHLISGTARIDYSFVTGESEPVRIAEGEKVYAGGRQTGDIISIKLEKEVAGSYLTSLWNNSAFTRDKARESQAADRIHTLSRYFTITLFSLAALVALYWAWAGPERILNAVTAMLIVACPCALLLSATFTNGNLLRLFSNAGLFLRDASVIGQLGRINSIAFDKTGTLTKGLEMDLQTMPQLTEAQQVKLYSVVRISNHPYSRALAHYLSGNAFETANNWHETVGQGVAAVVNGVEVRVGNQKFTGATASGNVHARIGDAVFSFRVKPCLRAGAAQMMAALRGRYRLSLLSGDHAQQSAALEKLLGGPENLFFEQKPADKLAFIEKMQQRGEKVLMLGDGLNDAGALQQSDVGITLADDINNFTPSCDAILDAAQLSRLPGLLALARLGTQTINAGFAVSILYNIVGLYYAAQGTLHPVIAAILMPSSTLSIVLISTGMSEIGYRRLFGKKKP